MPRRIVVIQFAFPLEPPPLITCLPNIYPFATLSPRLSNETNYVAINYEVTNYKLLPYGNNSLLVKNVLLYT